MNKHVFREYDIRGIVSDTLNLKDAYYIGYNFGKQIKDKFSSNTIVIGFDGRLSSPIIEKNLIEGLFDAGANIIRVGLCSSPMLYFSQIKLKADGAIMITGSHNPSNYNGFKILDNDFFFLTVSKSILKIFALGKFLFNISSTFCVPVPLKTKFSDLHDKQLFILLITRLQ